MRGRARIVQAADFKRILARFVAPANTRDAQTTGVGSCTGQTVLFVKVNQHQAAATGGLLFELGHLKSQNAATG